MALVAGIGTVIGGIFGAVGASKAESSQNAAIKAQYQYDMDLWQYNNQQARREFQFQKESNKIARQNNENELRYREATAIKDWQYGMQMRNFEYNTQVQAYKKSVGTFEAQTKFNDLALGSAVKQEMLSLTERRLENAFQSRDLDVQLMSDLDSAVFAKLGIENSVVAAKNSYYDQINELYFGREQARADTANSLAKVDFGVRSEEAKSQNLLNSLLGDMSSARASKNLDLKANDLEVAYAKASANAGLQKDAIDLGMLRAKSAFDTEDIELEALQATGKARASGLKGVSAQKTAQAIAASAGRSKARLSDAFSRARDASTVNRKQIIDQMTAAVAKGQINQGVIETEYSNKVRSMEKTLADNAVNLAVIQAYGSLDQAKLVDNLMRSDLQYMVKADSALQGLSTNVNDLSIKSSQVATKVDRDRMIYNQNKQKLGASLLSANLRTQNNIEQIAQDKMQADLDAWANVMLKPQLAPDLPKPLMLPRTIYQQPLKPEKPPKPIKGAKATGSVWSSVGSTIGALGGINWGGK